MFCYISLVYDQPIKVPNLFDILIFLYTARPDVNPRFVEKIQIFTQNSRIKQKKNKKHFKQCQI